jgi:hypothetical protein
MTNNKQDHIVEANKMVGSVQWFFDQLVANRIIVIDGSTYWDKVKTKYEILLEQAKEMEVMGKEMSYADGYADGYKRALELTQWTISNLIPPHNEQNN